MPRFFFFGLREGGAGCGIDVDADADEDWRLKIEDTGADEDEETDMDAGTDTDMDVDMDTDTDLVVRIIWHNFRYMAYEDTKSEVVWKKNKRKKRKGMKNLGIRVSGC